MESGDILFTFFCLWYVGTICKGTFVDPHIATVTMTMSTHSATFIMLHRSFDPCVSEACDQNQNLNHLERIPNWSELFHGSTSLACLELKSFSNFSPRPLPRNSVWINRDRYLAFLNIWRLTDSAGAFDTWAPMFCEKTTIFWWSNTAGTSPYVLVETRSPRCGWNLPTSYVCLPEVYCNASCNCYDCDEV